MRRPGQAGSAGHAPSIRRARSGPDQGRDTGLVIRPARGRVC